MRLKCGLTCTRLYISLSICCLTVVEIRFTDNSQDLRIMQLYFLGLLIFGTWQFTECGAECNEQNVGTVFCVKTNVNQHMQWATCLTNKYIQQQSSQAHRCGNEQATHCYYQCMLETHQDQGIWKDLWKYIVSSKCKCTPNYNASIPQLPAWCNSPDGTNCSWYQHCLKQRYPSCVEKGNDDYGVAEKLCQLYTNHNGSLSAKAEQWMDATRKCMQITLVPYIRPWEKASCETLKKKAFKSHRTCYLNPGQNKTSYCDLSFTDQMRIFWTIKFGIALTFTPGLKATWNILLDCLEKSSSSPENVELLHLKVDILNNYAQYEGYKKREENVGYLTGRVVDEIASRQKWQKKGLAWFAYPSKTLYFDSYYFITILLVDRYTYEATNVSAIFASRPSPPINVTSIALSEMVNEFQHGSFDTIETGTDKVAVLAMNQCADWRCTRLISNHVEYSWSTLSPTPTPTSAASTLSTVYLASTFLWLALHVVGDIF